MAIKRWGSHLHVYNLTLLPRTYGAVGLLAASALTEDLSSARWTPVALGSIAVSVIALAT